MNSFSVERRPDAWQYISEPADWPWHELSTLPPLLLADGSGPAVQQTEVRLCHDGITLFVYFVSHDRDIWGTFTERDDPIYDEEVVEIFLAPGADDPVEYAELEISPNGVLLDAWIVNRTGIRDEITADFDWKYPGIRWQVERNDESNRWCALIALPLRAFTNGGEIPSTWRANFYRIERPRGDAEEYSCWSPTLTTPADFHKPARFGRIDLA